MHDTERECVEWVLGLTGGELETKPLKFRAPNKWGEISDRTWKYHYDGLPEWASSDFPERFECNYFTLIEIGVSYESSAPDELTIDGERWFKVRTYNHSGETECPLGSSGDDETVGEAHTEGVEECPLCEEKKGEKHGYIYLGDCLENVYCRVDFKCAECGAPKPMSEDEPFCCEEE